MTYAEVDLAVDACKNKLHRIPISFATESIAEKLEPFKSDQPVIIVIEGVFMYLNEASAKQTMHSLQAVFPRHKLICDLMSQNFFDKYAHAIHKKFEALGARFTFTASNPEQLFINNGYRKMNTVSIASKAVEFKTLKIPKLVLNYLMTTFRTGYSVNIFETN